MSTRAGEFVTLREVVELYEKFTGCKLKPLGRWLLPILKLLKPTIFRWLYPSGASRVTLFSYFNKNDWVGDPHGVRDRLPEFRITSMGDYIRQG